MVTGRAAASKGAASGAETCVSAVKSKWVMNDHNVNDHSDGSGAERKARRSVGITRI